VRKGKTSMSSAVHGRYYNNSLARDLSLGRNPREKCLLPRFDVGNVTLPSQILLLA